MALVIKDLKSCCYSNIQIWCECKNCLVSKAYDPHHSICLCEKSVGHFHFTFLLQLPVVTFLICSLERSWIGHSGQWKDVERATATAIMIRGATAAWLAVAIKASAINLCRRRRSPCSKMWHRRFKTKNKQKTSTLNCKMLQFETKNKQLNCEM